MSYLLLPVAFAIWWQLDRIADALEKIAKAREARC